MLDVFDLGWLNFRSKPVYWCQIGFQVSVDCKHICQKSCLYAIRSLLRTVSGSEEQSEERVSKIPEQIP